MFYVLLGEIIVLMVFCVDDEDWVWVIELWGIIRVLICKYRLLIVLKLICDMFDLVYKILCILRFVFIFC